MALKKSEGLFGAVVVKNNAIVGIGNLKIIKLNINKRFEINHRNACQKTK